MDKHFQALFTQIDLLESSGSSQEARQVLLISELEQAAKEDPAWSFSVAEELITRRNRLDWVWHQLLSAWTQAEIRGDASTRIWRILQSKNSVIDSNLDAAASLLHRLSDPPAEGIEPQELIRIGSRILRSTDRPFAGDEIEGNRAPSYEQAKDHPAGRVTMAWIAALLSGYKRIADGKPNRIPPAFRAKFDKLLKGNSSNSAVGRCVLAHKIRLLFELDPSWTQEHLIRIFDWNEGHDRAAQAWAGFLASEGWDGPLFEKMLPHAIQTFGRLDQGVFARRLPNSAFLRTRAHGLLRDDDPIYNQGRFVDNLVRAAFFRANPYLSQLAHPPDSVRDKRGWLFEFVKDAPPALRALWARNFARRAESLSTQEVANLWKRWVHEYWWDRATGVPSALEEAERQALVFWVPALKANVAEAVELALQSPPEEMDQSIFRELDKSAVAEIDGRATGRLLAGLLKRMGRHIYASETVSKVAQNCLDHGANPDDIVAVAEEMARLGCDGAEELRNLAMKHQN